MSYNPNTGKIDPSWKTIPEIHDIFKGDNTEKNWQEILAKVKTLTPNSFLKQDFNGNTIAHLVMIKFFKDISHSSAPESIGEIFNDIFKAIINNGFTYEICPVNKIKLKVEPILIFIYYENHLKKQHLKNLTQILWNEKYF